MVTDVYVVHLIDDLYFFFSIQRLQNNSFRHLARHQKELQKHCYFFVILFLLPLMFWVWAAIPLSPMATLGNPQAVVFQGYAWNQHGHCVHWGAEPKTGVQRSLRLLFLLLLLLLLQSDQGSQEQLILCDRRRSSVCLKFQSLPCCFVPENNSLVFCEFVHIFTMHVWCYL